MLICPNCQRPLSRQESTLRCAAGHSFDLAASSYCNLLLSSRSGEKTGDSREMVAARRRFLDGGYYQPLAQAVCQRVLELADGRNIALADAGCGEGYYTRQVAQALDEANCLRQCVGIDIAKAATQYAARRDKRTQYVTGSVYHMPLAQGCADVVLSLFAPTPAQEFARVLADDGKLLLAVPGENHLWELKCAVYDRPYQNDESKHQLEGFRLCQKQKVTLRTRIGNQEDINTLFAMTPYAHRTPKQGLQRLHQLGRIDVTLDFALLTMEKER